MSIAAQTLDEDWRGDEAVDHMLVRSNAEMEAGRTLTASIVAVLHVVYWSVGVYDQYQGPTCKGSLQHCKHRPEGQVACRPLDSLMDAFKINVLGPLCVVRATLDLLMKGSSKTIINVSSTGGCLTGHAQTANPEGPAGKHLVVVNAAGLGYCVTKAGLNMGEPGLTSSQSVMSDLTEFNLAPCQQQCAPDE